MSNSASLAGYQDSGLTTRIHIRIVECFTPYFCQSELELKNGVKKTQWPRQVRELILDSDSEIFGLSTRKTMGREKGGKHLEKENIFVYQIKNGE